MCKAHTYLEQAEQSQLNAFNFLPKAEDVKMADDGVLKDLVVAVKDNIQVKSWPTTASSKILDGFVSPYDATVIARLKDAGATLLGKTNLDEFAMGSSTENSAFGPTKNPWDTDRVPGGSSGGSAAAVAAGLCDAALGSDTGGSIRQPAAFCGVTGLKPTYGAVSRYGLLALASSLDVIGPIARNAETVERVFAATAGGDEFDQTTDAKYKYQPATTELSKLKIALPKELWELEIDPEVKAAADQFVQFFKDNGATVEEVSLPSLPYALPAYYIILPAEASANLARYDGMRFANQVPGKNLLETYLKTRAQFGPEVKRRILLGTYALSVGHYDDYYQLAVQVQQQIAAEYAETFQKYDLIISPTTPTPAFKLGEKASDPVAMYQSDLLTVSANLAGVPGLSLPIGFTKENLPIGGQMIAKKFDDNVLLAVAKAYQQKTDYHTKTP